ncbi:hypothetical protein PSECIP111854_00395 [Pseudoalteromonas sp. CIP111854]|uniref:Solute-binding protein family 3/N-terminal domain-containing protein n=2 Tax=Pseudoalteromonas holothuriae TaxID=2963714 RepID=A0A9W4VLP2_9GAMM|nr:hypothetical protein PSECIP111854_00395 [Pseudoalteromonas sp. CIP111854]
MISIRLFVNILIYVVCAKITNNSTNKVGLVISSYYALVKFVYLFPFLATVMSHVAFANEPLTVAFGQSRPPYVNESSQSGISVELFDTIAKTLNWQYHPIFVSNKRMVRLLAKGKVDIAVEVQNSDKHMYYSMPFISYSNYAIHNRHSEFKLSSMSELLKYSVCAWQNAAEHLVLDKAFKDKEDYSEYSKQQEQVIDWLSGQCEVILIDDTLLNWHLAHLKEGRYQYSPENWGKALLPAVNNPLWFYVGFRNEALRSSFNFGLQQLKASGRYEQLRLQIK